MFKPARDTQKDKVYEDDKELGEIQGKRVYNPETGEWEVVQEVTVKMDTVQWVALPPNQFPPITSEGEFTDVPVNEGTGEVTPEGSEKKSFYNISYLLPFNTTFSNAGKIDKRSKWAVNFYAGAKMALDQLGQEGISLQVDVMDTQGNPSRVKNLLATNEALQASDVVIGPYRRNNVYETARWALQEEKVMVSPFSASMGLTRNNPNYLQINPSLKSHCQAIMQHVLDNYNAADVVMIARDIPEERERMSYFQEAKLAMSADTTALAEVLITEESADFNEINIRPLINIGEQTVFIVPSYKSEPFVYSILRKLALAKKPNDRIVVYGLPPWQNFTRIDFDYYENLNVHISSGGFVDNFNPEVRLFKRQYFERFNAAPEDEAILGYDVTLFTGRMLQKYGTKFQLYIEQEGNEPYLGASFLFERVVNDGNAVDDRLDYFDQFENKFVHILKFDNYYFQPAD